MTDITELAQRARINAECGEHLSPAETLELVEALESEKRICATWRKTAKSTGEKLEKAQTINAAAEKLVRCKGRYHSERNYRALAALFGVTTPDLPPLDSESRTFTVKLPPKIERDDADGWFMYNGGRVGGGAAEWYNKALDDVSSALGVDVREAE